MKKMKKWWVGIIVLVAYAYILAEYLPQWVDFIVVCGVAYYFWIKSGETKKHKTDTYQDQVNKNYLGNGVNPFTPGKTITCFVAGVTFEGRQDVIKHLSIGDRLLLIRDKGNIYDTNAIQVLKPKSEIEGSRSSIGFIPREIAAKVAQYFDEFTSDQFICKGKVIAFIQPTSDTTGVEISFKIPSEDWLEIEQMYYLNTQFPTY